MTFLPYSRPVLDEEEIAEVVDTLRSGWLTTGPKVAQFEKDFTEFIGCKHALAVNSATSGLHLALEALGVGEGDKVITTVHTFTASAEVIRYLGGEPLFADIDPDTFCIDPEHVRRLLEEHSGVKCIIPVHYGGQAADMTALLALAKEFDVRVVEDAAHALPCTHNGRMVGTMSDVTVFSFYANKTITTGEGGMVVTDDEAIAKRVKTMRLHGINRDVFDRFTSKSPSWHYEVVAPGYKYNMMDMCGALGIHQLKKAHKFQQQRKYIAECYEKGFAGLPVETPGIVNPEDFHAWHIYALRLNLDELTISRDTFIEKLSEKGVGTSVHYIPLHRMPYWRDTYGLKDETYPQSTAVFNRIISLPNFASMTDDDINFVINAVREVATAHAK
ncbi:DegT/DnrJ/EryC1/StrS family aminotransferase [Halodesulfovibrio spirochaetisodalis]|uniref:Pyridoxal phosphate-dependent aminotransferase n=1 Tax=Halodesulfovibrio spirochaetisodalis TaxID=1560234 RepID=A0A1B7XI52_9BACT|nr:DegT/DnrJ/EryC1/StrS aminotransferase family protein [Halodesulfovibrio spirochaetisodalis]OBQ55175.1 pyridoxal phosphate-dependent aminotransferase [Halodesulfovibrio spirochaetisodalis]